MLNSTLSDKGFLRIKDWWWSKAALLMGMVYLFTAWFNISFQNFVPLALLSITTISGFASVGYLFNDFFDREKDALAGKKNFLAGKPFWLIAVYLTTGFSFLFLPWLYLPFTKISCGLIAAELFLFLIYSLPPFRLKEKSIAGIIIDALYAHTLPVMLAAYTFSLAAGKQILLLRILLLIGWQTCSGIRNILLHQHDDLLSDAKAGNKNRVAVMGEKNFFSSVKYLITAEVMLSVLFFATLAQQNRMFLLCVALIMLWSFVTFFKFRKQGMNLFMDTYWKHFPNNVYEKWIPPANLLILSAVDIKFAGVLFLHVLLFNHEFYYEAVKRIYPVVRDAWVNSIQIPMRKLSSIIINYPVYYLFLMFGVDLKKENTSALDYLKKRNARKP